MNSPARHGDLPVLFTTYGSGNDLHRIEFGEGAGFMSRSVDGSKLIDNWKGGGGWARSSYWGFGTDELPVQGRIWYPQGDGRYPLVLIVHGNHQMEDYSDPGYEYLGRLLASRGYIFVSVDENFLNLSMADLINPLKPYLEEENDARGWLLLEHLVQWREWNQTVGHVFYDKVDMEEISLIGHSRGGEAVAIAGYFNDLAYYPDDASVPFDYRFNLKGVIAIAPVDGQYKPRDNGTRLRNTSYFVIHGSLDSDVTSFMGLTQFSRTDLHHSNEFKASLYVHGANHGQFNSSWGNQDTALGWSLRKAAIMPAEWQRQIVEVYFSAFLDVVHKGRKEYMPIFKNSRFAAGWLPDTYYINNFKDADSLWLLTFEEDGDPATATLGSASVRTNNLSRWYESWIGLKWRPLETHVAGLAWDDRFSEDTASLEIHFSEPIDLTDFDSLIFSVSQGTGSTLPKDHETGESDKEAKSDEQEEDMKSSLLDWSIVVIDNKGISSKTLLSQVEPLHPQVNEDAFRLQFGNPSPKSEAILKYYSFPIENFSNETGSFNSGSVIEIRFQFDQTARGHIILDDVGLSRKAPGV
jgi:dienelactone hydrolase